MNYCFTANIIVTTNNKTLCSKYSNKVKDQYFHNQEITDYQLVTHVLCFLFSSQLLNTERLISREKLPSETSQTITKTIAFVMTNGQSSNIECYNDDGSRSKVRNLLDKLRNKFFDLVSNLSYQQAIYLF